MILTLLDPVGGPTKDAPALVAINPAAIQSSGPEDVDVALFLLGHRVIQIILQVEKAQTLF
jgi:hypothetical protein